MKGVATFYLSLPNKAEIVCCWPLFAANLAFVPSLTSAGCLRFLPVSYCLSRKRCSEELILLKST